MSKRPRKSGKLKLFEGGRLPNKGAGPLPTPKAPEPPMELSDIAKQVWREIAPKLERLGLLTEIDQDSFAILCALRGTTIELETAIRDMEPGPDKMRYARELRLNYGLFQKFAGLFGLSPRAGLAFISSRTRATMILWACFHDGGQMTIKNLSRIH